MKIGLLQCNLNANAVSCNKKSLLDGVRKAHAAGAELCVSSELSLCGCPGTDLLLRKTFADFCRKTLEEITGTLKQEKLPPLLLGAPVANPVPQGKPLHNCSVLLRDGEVAVISRKVLLAADGSHDDHNYFEPGVACGVLQFNGWRFCVAIGEDVWNDRGFWKKRRRFDGDPVKDFMSSGADALINLTAIPYYVGGQALHRRMLSWTASKYRVPVICVNQIGGMDSAVYPGGSMMLNSSGALCLQAPMFQEAVMVVELEKDVEKSMQAQDDNMLETWQALVLGVRDFVRKSGFSKVVMGLSGGVDSALVAVITVEALGRENVLGVMMPSPSSHEESLKDSKTLAANLGIETLIIPIEKAVQAYDVLLCEIFKDTVPNMTEENIQSRIRSNILMAISNKFGRLVLNAGNKSEAAMGYCALYGDLSGALSVIGDLYKFQVYDLCRWINAQRGFRVIPQSVLDKRPSAELLAVQENGEPVWPYTVLDPILKAHIDDMQDINGLISLGFAPEIAGEVIKTYRKAEFKRQQSPPALYLSRHAFGQRGYWPIATTWEF
jgi:NAD+ synthase (glutamine-hydrolysing)